MSSRYEGLSSPYIKQKLEQTSWEHHRYIDELDKLHKFILVGPNSLASAILFNYLKNNYQEEYFELLEVVDPARAQREKEEKAQQREETERRKEQRNSELAQAREAWLRAGGKE